MYPGRQGQPPYPGGPGQPGPQGPYPGQQYPPQQYPPPQYPQYQAPPQPYPPQYQQPQPQAPNMQLGEGHMVIDPNLTAHQRSLVIRIQKNVRVYVIGFFCGVPFTAGGLHAVVGGKPQGLLFALAGLAALAFGTVFFLRTRVLREQLRQILPDAWRSPAAHLPGARRAATLAAWLKAC